MGTQLPGIAGTLDGSSMPNADTGETFNLQWAQGAPGLPIDLQNGRAAAIGSSVIPMLGCTQLAIGYINQTALAVDCYLFIKWMGDRGNVGALLEDAALIAGALAGGVQRWSTPANDFQLQALSQRSFLIPCAWHFAQFFVYSDGAAVAGQRVTLLIERGTPPQPTGSL